MSEKVADIFATRDVPHMSNAVTIPGSDVLTVGRPGNCLHCLIIFTIGRDGTSREGIPNTHALIPGTGDNIFPIWRPHDSLDQAFTNAMGVPVIVQDICPAGGFPYLHGLVTTTRSDQLPIG